MQGNPSANGSTRQRLVLCLDGTWNTRDSGTNVYHLSNLIVDDGSGNVPDGIRQKVYYDEGVGTGLLDSITGGAFGIGLSQNVREAYDWLVEHYDDDDEIYVFGFSRGAFTARSLVGLIARCGLLRRGAPLSPGELWRAYQVLGRHGNAVQGTVPSKSLRERLFGRPARPFRSVWTLDREDWELHDERKPVPPENRSERMLLLSSRRVRIKCVGVFDTVGSMGVDALAIPWLRDRLALFHDTHLTSIIENGYHALAIDEHRANFAHIPWYTKPGETRTSFRIDGEPREVGEVEQCWFVGAHSNVGGGYESDTLARFPLAWMVGKCKELGLRFRESDARAHQELPTDLCLPLLRSQGKRGDPLPTRPSVRDSYREFARGFWQHFVRAKRNYRRIGPPPALIDGKPAQSANETVHESVLRLMKADADRPRYSPPNLWAYHDRRGETLLPEPEHRYLSGTRALQALGLWLIAIAFAGWWLGGAQLKLGWLVALALIALGVDWSESWCNHRLALKPDGPTGERGRTVLEGLLYVRLVLFGMFLLGSGVALWRGVEVAQAWLLTSDAAATANEHTWWLLALDVAFLLLGGSFAWTGAPMNAAGLGSIVPLQRSRTPDHVLTRLREWTKTKGEPASKDRELLMPVARSLWRDMFSLVPTYSIVLCLGVGAALSLLRPERIVVLGASLPDAWWIALAFAGVCALADCLEDVLQLGFVGRYPELAGARSVRLSFAATCVKFVFLVVGAVVTLLAFAWLAFLELRESHHGGMVRAIALLLSLGIPLVMLREYLGGHENRPRWMSALLGSGVATQERSSRAADPVDGRDSARGAMPSRKGGLDAEGRMESGRDTMVSSGGQLHEKQADHDAKANERVQ